jgi:hypothetical protein
MESWQEIESGGNPEHEGAEDKIGRENVHGADPCSRFAVPSGLTIDSHTILL